MADPNFAQSDADAAARYLRFGNVDPFPTIEPALLNSTDVADYVAATGMIYPFDYPAKLKSATYEVALLGPYTYWDEQFQRVEDTLERGDEFVLPPNTIAFVSLEAKFRVPTYLALRFNLHIKFIHRGLLLGTGPIVDPGFEGQLAVPVHNLTSNAYTLRGGEGLIWLEVTKVSPPRGSITSKLDPQLGRQNRKFIAFDPTKRNLTLRDYLYRAYSGRPIASSIGSTAERAGVAAESARGEAARARMQLERFRNVGFIAGALGLAAVVIGMASVAIGSWMLVHDVDSRLANETKTVVQLQADEQRSRQQISSLQNQLCGQHSATASVPCPSPVGSPPLSTKAP